MKVRIAIEQIIDIDDGMSNDMYFDLYGPTDMSNDDKVDYLVSRFIEDLNTLAVNDELSNQVLVEYIED
jgi:hypothetical protein